MKSTLYYGDNLDVMRTHIAGESVDLCYIDPPFNSKRNYNQIYNNIGNEDMAQSIAFTDKWEWTPSSELYLDEIMLNERRIFPRQAIRLIKGFLEILGKGSMLAYIVSMTVRIAEIHRVLKPTGSFYLHCDPTMSHYLKLVLDAIFCGQGGEFLSEIIWWYLWGGRGKTKWNNKHDTIFFYSKSSSWMFNYLEVLDDHNLMAQGSKNRVKYKGALVTSKSHFSEVPQNKVLPSDTWYIATINAMSKERLGYPTQKPEALLERIIKASSDEYSVILDAYCGCGTTVAVAQRLGRKWLGIDITYQSIALIKKRLSNSYGTSVMDEIDIMGIPVDMQGVIALVNNPADRTRKEFEKWAILTYTDSRAMINEKKGGDGGIDGCIPIPEGKSVFRDVLFSVKSGKINPGMIRDFHGTITRENAAAGIFITLEKPTKGMLEEAAKAGIYKNEHFNKNIEKIKIITVEQILNGTRSTIPDIVEAYKRAQPATDKEYEQTELT
jgi:site-specific DNA-methyltransferase (adenine-specific)